MPPVRDRRAPRASQRGLTIVELMIAMTVALMVLGTLAVFLAGASRNRASLERSARLIENAQYAMDLLRDDITQAGYYDALTTSIVPWRVPDPCAVEMDDLGWSAPGTSPPAAPASIVDAPVLISGVRRAGPPPA